MLTGKTNEEKIWNYLVGKGLSKAGAAGLMGNLNAESALNPKNLQDSYEKKLGYTDDTYTAAVDSGSYGNFVHDSAGYGLAQWTYWSRKQNMLSFARAAGKSIGDLEMQLDFLYKELSEGYKGVLNTLKTTGSVRTASDSVLLNFERPADQSEAVKTKRAGYGQSYYNKYAGGSSASTGGTAHTGGTNMSKLYASAVIAVAVAEIGYKEKASNSNLDDKTANAGSANYTRYAAFFDQECPSWYNGKKNGYAWCDMFVDYCFHKAYGHENALKLLCQPEKSAGAGCTYSYAYYKAKGQVGTTPKVGTQIFFGYSASNLTHTGIVEKFDATYVYTIEGNTSDQVARRTYKRNAANIFGYGYPAFDEEGSTSGGTTTTPSTPSTGTSTATTGSLKVGDIVEFTGTKHYSSANAASGPACKPGKAKITQIYQLGKSKHPYHLVAVSGGGSTVYGWVDAADISGAASSAAATKTYTVKSGDSLWAIAAKQLGDGSRYKEIKSLNNLTSDTIHPGQVLKLPN